MSYQVLARKWRPQNFTEMVGQEHVLRALINALDSERLHHAYLFTGTRGVGKTTIARILAKCLNCEMGVTSKPCGTCNSCVEIAAGNFLDLIEVDAASRTKVEDTRELLENVQYAPTRARFKVYLIDEVHMLTGHSFNALLKTLEEPPPHVKFLFATTDPQKLPATVLSRCLQFNLKRMPLAKITTHLAYLLEQESIVFENPALKLLAKAADGSMRDALSLLDQAIAYSGEIISETAVRDMLGTVSHEPLVSLLETIASGDGATLLGQVDELASITPDFDASCDALIALLHQVAVLQVIPDAIDDDESARHLAQTLSKEDVQLFYQIALQGRADLALSPDPKSGFEMILLRMLSFRPLREGMRLETDRDSTENDNIENNKKKTLACDDVLVDNTIAKNTKAEINSEQASQSLSASDSVSDTENNTKTEVLAQTNNIEKSHLFTAQSTQEAPPWEEIPDYENLSSVPPQFQTSNTDSEAIIEIKKATPKESNIQDAAAKPEDTTVSEHAVASKVEKEASKETNSKVDPEICRQRLKLAWHQVVPELGLSGRAAELIKHCLLAGQDDGIISLLLDKDSEGLLAENIEHEIQTALCSFYGVDYQLKVQINEAQESDLNSDVLTENETPAQRAQRKTQEKQQQAELNIESDPFVLELMNRFNAKIVPGSIAPKNSNG